MFVVALTDLRTSAEQEVVALARDLGSTPYEQRLVLNQGLPTVVLRTPDRDRATRLLQALRDRQHGAVAIDDAAVAASNTMTALRAFRFTPTSVIADEAHPDVALPFDDVLAFVRAQHRTQFQTTTETKEKQFSMGRASMTGGLMMRKSVKRTQTTTTEEREGVCYVFRKSGEAPWIIRTSQPRFAALGAHLQSNSHQNFVETLRQLRELAPHAPYDERLVSRRGTDRIAREAGGNATVSSESGVDLLAHLVAMMLRPR